MPSAVGGEEAMNGPTTTARRLSGKRNEKHGVDEPAQFTKWWHRQESVDNDAQLLRQGKDVID